MLDRRRLGRAVLAVALAGLAACQPAAPAAPTPAATPAAAATLAPGTLYVDASRDLGPISPLVYGTNYGPAISVPFDLKPQALAARITYLRFPGGAWGDQNNLTHLQIDRYIQLAREMGSEPNICARLRGGTPEQAAALVQYANVEQKYNVRYWSIGNEPSLYASAKTEDYDTERYNREWRAMAEAMRAVDPTIRLIGPDLHGAFTANAATNPKDARGRDWMTEFLKANGDLVDIITVHRYPVYAPTSPVPITPATLRENTLEWNQYVIYLRSLIHDISGRDLPVAFTEVNSDPTPGVVGGSATPDSFYNAIWYADVLGRLIQERVFMVNQWVFAYRTGGLGLIFGSELRPTYYVFQMYSHFGSEQVLATSGVKYITVYASKREDGTLTIMVINLLDTEQTIPLNVEGVSLSKAKGWLLDADHKAVEMGEQSFPTEGKLVLPAQSISLYALGK